MENIRQVHAICLADIEPDTRPQVPIETLYTGDWLRAKEAHIKRLTDIWEDRYRTAHRIVPRFLRNELLNIRQAVSLPLLENGYHIPIRDPIDDVFAWLKDRLAYWRTRLEVTRTERTWRLVAAKAELLLSLVNQIVREQWGAVRLRTPETASGSRCAMTELHANNAATGIVTHCQTEDGFVRTLASAIRKAVTEHEASEHDLCGWLAQAFEIVGQYRGYKTQAEVYRYITIGGGSGFSAATRVAQADDVIEQRPVVLPSEGLA